MTKRERVQNSLRQNSEKETVHHFVWTVGAIGVHLEEVYRVWAKTLGVSVPQWMILMALSDFDDGHGVRVNEVSKILQVDPSFVTTQSKLLEKQGYLRRKASPHDARAVQTSLTEKAVKELAKLRAQQEKIFNFVFCEFNDREFEKLLKGLSLLKDRLEKASVMAGLNLGD